MIFEEHKENEESQCTTDAEGPLKGYAGGPGTGKKRHHVKIL